MHWKNSRFEMAYIVLGNCHTYDEAYRVLCEVEEDRVFSIESSLAESLRSQAKVISAKATLEDESETHSATKLAQAYIQEQRARRDVAQPCLDEARRELSFIRELKSAIQPYRRYSDYSDAVAHQLCQSLEWRFDIHWKSYNYLMTSNMIPHDHLMLIQMHPDSSILLEGLRALRQENDAILTKSEVLRLVCTGDETQSIASPHVFDSIVHMSLLSGGTESEQPERKMQFKIGTDDEV